MDLMLQSPFGTFLSILYNLQSEIRSFLNGKPWFMFIDNYKGFYILNLVINPETCWQEGLIGHGSIAPGGL